MARGHWGVYLDADHAEPIDYLAGSAVQGVAAVPDGVEVRAVPVALYAMFECSFQDIGPTYGHWSEWLKSSAVDHDTSKLGFDDYAPTITEGDSQIEIWFPVKRKDRYWNTRWSNQLLPAAWSAPSAQALRRTKGAAWAAAMAAAMRTALCAHAPPSAAWMAAGCVAVQRSGCCNGRSETVVEASCRIDDDAQEVSDE